MIDTEPKNDRKYNYYKKILIYISNLMINKKYHQKFKFDESFESDDEMELDKFLIEWYIYVSKLKNITKEERIGNYTNFCCSCIKFNAKLFRYVIYNIYQENKNDICEYYDLCIQACQNDGLLLRYVKTNFCKTYDYICKKAIEQNPSAEKYIATYIKCYTNGNIRFAILDNNRYKYYKNSYKFLSQQKIFYKNKTLFFY